MAAKSEAASRASPRPAPLARTIIRRTTDMAHLLAIEDSGNTGCPRNGRDQRQSCADAQRLCEFFETGDKILCDR
jgi:hypothetical protein